MGRKRHGAKPQEIPESHVWSRRGQPGPGVGLATLVISPDARSLPFLHHGVPGMAPEVCILFPWNIPTLQDTWVPRRMLSLELHAFELAGSTTDHLPLSHKVHRSVKTVQKSPSLRSQFPVAAAVNYLKQHKFITTQFWKWSSKWACRLLGRICFIVFSSFVTSPTCLVSWPLPPT